MALAEAWTDFSRIKKEEAHDRLLVVGQRLRLLPAPGTKEFGE
ncbi:hypothetical protein [Methylacidiphilum kamchatkense]|nr:hypothetical protein [Methylacidiphilum kamchatkense]